MRYVQVAILLILLAAAFVFALQNTQPVKVQFLSWAISPPVPILILVTLRGAFGDYQKGHASNGLYLQPILEAINMPYAIIDKEEDIRRAAAEKGKCAPVS